MRKSFLFLSVAVAPLVHAQVPTRTYAKHDVELAEPFSQIAGLRELSDGRVIVSDTRDKTLQLIDFRGGPVRKIGREGSGPGEWLLLSRLLALPGDTTLMPDARNNRFLVIAPDGTPVRTITPEGPATNVGGMRISAGGGVLAASFADARGRLYYTDATFSFSGGGPPPALPDSLPIIRHDIRTQARDTIAFVKRPPSGRPSTVSVGNATASTSAPLPFTTGDAWTVLPDGRVSIVRAADYRVEIVTARDARTVGPRVSYTPVAVTAADRKAFLDNQKATAGQRRITVNGVTSAAPPPPEPTEWPATMPPFLAGAAVASPAGETWVLRARSATDPVPTYDVFNGEGRQIARVVLPAKTRVVGFGAKSVYLVRTDSDDLQYLQRYTLIG